LHVIWGFKQFHHSNLIIFSTATISIMWKNLPLIIISLTQVYFKASPWFEWGWEFRPR
jgi:hypothetical protein